MMKDKTALYIPIDALWRCETCYYSDDDRKCSGGMWFCDHGESYRPAYNKLEKLAIEIEDKEDKS